MYKILFPVYIDILIIALMDYRKRFIDIEMDWPESVGDGRIFRNSRLNNVLEA